MKEFGHRKVVVEKSLSSRLFLWRNLASLHSLCFGSLCGFFALCVLWWPVCALVASVASFALCVLRWPVWLLCTVCALVACVAYVGLCVLWWPVWPMLHCVCSAGLCGLFCTVCASVACVAYVALCVLPWPVWLRCTVCALVACVAYVALCVLPWPVWPMLHCVCFRGLCGFWLPD